LVYGWGPWRAIAGGGGAFVGWAVGRELDPDRTATAAVAGVLALVGGFFEPAALFISVAFLVAGRLTAGTVGASMSWLDVLILAVWGYATGGAIWYWPVGIAILGWALLAPEAGPRRYYGAVSLAAGFIVAWFLAPIQPLALERDGLYAAAVVLLVGAVSLIRCTASVDSDARSGTVTAARIRLARTVMTLCLVVAIAGVGIDAVWDLQPVLAALVAAAIVSLASRPVADSTPDPGSGLSGSTDSCDQPIRPRST
jgi:hypothetical protein